MIKHVNSNDMEWEARDGPDGFGSLAKALALHADTCGIGCTLYRIEPGKTALPAHAHYGNDEAIYVLKGTLTVRLDGQDQRLSEGSYMAFKRATGIAHQILNTSTEMVELLCISTMNDTDVVMYPDSGKLGIMGGYAPGGPDRDGMVVEFMKRTPVDYWDDEEA